MVYAARAAAITKTQTYKASSITDMNGNAVSPAPRYVWLDYEPSSLVYAEDDAPYSGNLYAAGEWVDISGMGAEYTGALYEIEKEYRERYATAYAGDLMVGTRRVDIPLYNADGNLYSGAGNLWFVTTRKNLYTRSDGRTLYEIKRVNDTTKLYRGNEAGGTYQIRVQGPRIRYTGSTATQRIYTPSEREVYALNKATFTTQTVKALAKKG